MTTPSDATASQALLALYGALDRAVTRSHGGPTEEIVERYLPGSTGVNAGWYDELLGFLGDRSHAAPGGPDSLPAAPDLDEALTVLQESHRSSADGSSSDTLSTVQLSRMVYAIGALSHLPGYQRHGEQFSRTLAIVSPAVEALEPSTLASVSDDLSLDNDELLTLLQRSFLSRDDWTAVMRDAVSNSIIDPNVAAVPQCDTKAKWVRGQLCAVLTTGFDSPTVSLNQLKNVIDPLNWARCLSFFCKMEPEPSRQDGWSRVLEHVSTTCSIAGTPQMVTPLKYWKGPPTGESLITAYIDYALDDLPVAGEKGDGRVVVDEGFIRMTSTGTDPAAPGVQVRTRKVVGFRDLLWIAGAIFACSMGYGYEGIDMLLNGVNARTKNSAGWTDWAPSTSPAGQSQHSGDPQPPAEPSDISRRAVVLAADMLTECIDDMARKSAAIAAKWSTGAAPIEETIAYSNDLAIRLATDPWRYLQRLSDPSQGKDK